MSSDKLDNYTSNVTDILNLVWRLSNITSYTTLNQGMRDVLINLIKLGIKFQEDDYEYIRTHYKSGYWLVVSLNGKHTGECFYDMGCSENLSFCTSYEKSTGRVPFLLGSTRLHEGSEFTDKKLCYKVTGWNEDNKKINVVAYTNRMAKGKRKLFSFDRENWLSERKNFSLL